MEVAVKYAFDKIKLIFKCYILCNRTKIKKKKFGGKQMFENVKVFNYTLAGRPLSVEIGKVAGLANGSCMISYGDTVILHCFDENS